MDNITKRILDIFTQISAVPRCSKNEEGIRNWLITFGKKHNWNYKTDNAGNVVFSVPHQGEKFQQSGSVVIQNHMDMVCVKTEDSTHDFSKDPISLVYDGDWLRADGTTLGADNGMGMALALGLATDPEISHPPLELLFTVDEETGLTGASNIGDGMVTGKILLNIDSEGEGIFTIGCAGGGDTNLTLKKQTASNSEEFKTIRLYVSGLTGGHSGVDINRGRANAIKIAAHLLKKLQQEFRIELFSLEAGHAHNVIPGTSKTEIGISPNNLSKLKTIITSFTGEVNNGFPEENNEIAIHFEEIPKRYSPLTPESADTLIDLLLALPHGVTGMTANMPELVETSSNLAAVKIGEDEISILTSQRSSSAFKFDEISNQIVAVADLAGAKSIRNGSYPSWQPDFSSPLTARFKKLYTELFKKEPVIEVIHAGLECGIIGSRFPGMDMISLGPTIQDPHSPDERLYIPTISKLYTLIKTFLEQSGDN